MTVQSQIVSPVAAQVSTDKLLIQSPGLIELTEFELEGISGAGWFKKTFGFSTPKFLKDLDDSVRAKVPGGWVGVVGKVIGMAYGGGGLAMLK